MTFMAGWRSRRSLIKSSPELVRSERSTMAMSAGAVASAARASRAFSALAADFEVGLRAEKIGEPFAHERMVVDEENATGWRAVMVPSGRRA